MNTVNRTRADLEALTRDYGRAIFSRLEPEGPLLFTPDWWDDRLMEWTMSDEAVKVQLFRFIDVLPLLRSPADISRHLREYFAEADAHLPALVRHALRWLPNDGFLGRLLAAMTDISAKRMARRFIAGANLPEALAAIGACDNVRWLSRWTCLARRPLPRPRQNSIKLHAWSLSPALASR